MNVSDPLWNSPTPIPISIISSSSSQIASTQPQRYLELYQRATPTTSSYPNTSSTTIYEGSASPTAVTGDFLQSQTDQIVNAITSSTGGAPLWTFKSSWYIAVIVTVLTIMLPLVAGRTFRGILRFSYNHKNYWHVAVFSIVFAVLVVLDIFIHPVIFLAVFGGPQCFACRCTTHESRDI